MGATTSTNRSTERLPDAIEPMTLTSCETKLRKLKVSLMSTVQPTGLIRQYLSIIEPNSYRISSVFRSLDLFHTWTTQRSIDNNWNIIDMIIEMEYQRESLEFFKDLDKSRRFECIIQFYDVLKTKAIYEIKQLIDKSETFFSAEEMLTFSQSLPENVSFVNHDESLLHVF